VNIFWCDIYFGLSVYPHRGTSSKLAIPRVPQPSPRRVSAPLLVPSPMISPHATPRPLCNPSRRRLTRGRCRRTVSGRREATADGVTSPCASRRQRPLRLTSAAAAWILHRWLNPAWPPPSLAHRRPRRGGVPTPRDWIRRSRVGPPPSSTSARCERRRVPSDASSVAPRGIGVALAHGTQSKHKVLGLLNQRRGPVGP